MSIAVFAWAAPQTADGDEQRAALPATKVKAAPDVKTHPGETIPPGPFRSLLRAGTDRRLATDSDTYRKSRKLLPDRFLEYETRRFVVLSDAKPAWTRRQSQLLDRTYHQFHRYTRRLGTRPQPLRHKLVCVLFQEYHDYREFARTHDNVTADWISGYYSPKNDRVVFYNIETNPEYGRAGARDSTVDPDWVARGGFVEELEAAATATTVHEAVHQLAFHTRIQTARIQNPLWLSEGLATAFETDRPNGSFGPDQEYSIRREQFDYLLEHDQLIPLRELVSYSQMPNDDEDTIAAVYHQSYALVTWMSRFRQAEMRRFFDALRREPPGRPSARRHVKLFEKAFGDVDRLERAWLRYEKSR